MKRFEHNNPPKPTAQRVSRSLQKQQQISVPRYGGLVPPLGFKKET
jgi:hypothetical protein